MIYQVDCYKVKTGSVLIADGGFSCLHEGQKCLVKEDEENNLYIDCDDGDHYLDYEQDPWGDYIYRGFILE